MLAASQPRPLATARVAGALAAPLIASPALADRWTCARDESHHTAWHGNRGARHRDGDDWRGRAAIAGILGGAAVGASIRQSASGCY